MRDLKFRAWDEERKRMFYSVLQEDAKILGAKVGESCIGKFFERFYGQKIMQYTGLKDKQGIPIYEGDITERMSWIGWCEKCCSFELFLVDFGCMGCSGDERWDETISNPLEVLGNIYEHSNLLEIK